MLNSFILKISFLITLLASAHTRAEPPLITAVFQKDISLIKKLLALGADPLEPKEDGATAIDLAIWSGNDIIKELIIQHRHPATGETPLIKAVYLQRLDIVAKLLDNGANPFIAKNDGANAIDFAIWGENKDIKYAILNYRDQSKGGETPLIKAIWEKDLNKTKILLENGANPYLAKSDGANAFDFAGYNNDDRFITLLTPYKGLLSSYCGTWDLFRRINLASSLINTYEGKGINIAVFDSGINFSSPNLSSNQSIPGGGILLDDQTAGYNISDEDRLYTEGGHGTHMAAILQGIRNKELYQGIAPQTKILPMSDWFATSYVQNLEYLSTHKAINIISSSLHASFSDILFKGDETKNPNAILVIIAGNNTVYGKTETTNLEQDLPLSTTGSLEDLPIFKKLIVTVAVDWKNELTPQSKRCGKLAPVCIAVPSTGATSPTTPIVVGALALLMEAFPGHKVEIYQKAILETATPLNSAFTETGVGLLNVQGAFDYIKHKKYQ
jgi:uncharacterized protein